MSRRHVELVWRSVLGPPGHFAEWVRDLSDKSGVYLIRSNDHHFTDELLYIGESHTYHNTGPRRRYRGLYRTLTRHFHGHNWAQGITYDPHHVLVAAIITLPEQAVKYQDALIRHYSPRDNEEVRQIRLEAWGMSDGEFGDYEDLYDAPDEDAPF